MQPLNKRGDTKNQILKAACLLLERQGMDAVSIRKIAKSVGITPMGIYNHFANLDALLVAVYEKGVGKLSRQIWKGIIPAEDPVEKLRSLVKSYITFGIKNPQYYTLLFGSEFIQKYSWENPPRSLIMQNFWVPLSEVIETCQQGEYIRSDLNPQEIATHLWATMHGYVSFFIIGRLQQLWQMDERSILQSMEKHLFAFLNTSTA
jgi:AcrR family transcriptional regulator